VFVGSVGLAYETETDTHSTLRQCKLSIVEWRQGKARQGKARQGKARQRQRDAPLVVICV